MQLSGFDKLTTSFIPIGSRVLDLGCADGKIGQFIENNLACQVTGVEVNQNLAHIASSRLTKVIVGDLENPQIQAQILRQGKYGVIFASAILEHLVNPEAVIKNLKKNLKKDGFMIATLPNIAFWQIRFNLLKGSFQYTNSGILDKTHIHLFTTKTAANFISKKCRLKILKIEYDFPGSPILHRISKIIPLLDSRLEETIHRRFPNFFAYQTLIVSRKKND